MALLKCDICGGTLSIDAGGKTATCEFCGAKHSIERMREKEQKIKGSVSIEGEIHVSGIANIDNLEFRAQHFLDEGNGPKALEYCNKILDLDPQNEVARHLVVSLKDKMQLKNNANYEGRILSVEKFGVYIEVYPCCEKGFIHISKMQSKRDKSLKVGDKVNVRYLGIDKLKRYQFTME